MERGTLFKKLRRGAGMVLVAAVVILFLLMIEFSITYYCGPMEKEMSFTAEGCLIFDRYAKQYVTVPVEVKGKNLNYIFHNREDAIQGDIWVNGYSLFGEERVPDSVGFGFYSMFHPYSPGYAWVGIGDGRETLCEVVCISKDWSRIVCVIRMDSDMGLEGDLPPGTMAVLAIPAETPEAALELLEEAMTKSGQMNKWLYINGWIDESEKNAGL